MLVFATQKETLAGMCPDSSQRLMKVRLACSAAAVLVCGGGPDDLLSLCEGCADAKLPCARVNSCPHLYAAAGPGMHCNLEQGQCRHPHTAATARHSSGITLDVPPGTNSEQGVYHWRLQGMHAPLGALPTTALAGPAAALTA